MYPTILVLSFLGMVWSWRLVSIVLLHNLGQVSRFLRLGESCLHKTVFVTLGTGNLYDLPTEIFIGRESRSQRSTSPYSRIRIPDKRREIWYLELKRNVPLFCLVHTHILIFHYRISRRWMCFSLNNGNLISFLYYPYVIQSHTRQYTVY